jgi:three-Cys-motif partner protein
MPNRKKKPPINHEWIVGQPPPLLRSHSEAKHRILRSYLALYIKRLTANIRRDTLKLRLVDGFSGGGVYIDARTKEECSGSPLIMLESVKQAQVKLASERTKPFDLDVEYHFIESNKEHFEYLKATINASEYREMLGSKISLIHTEFLTIADSMINRFADEKPRRSIFVLDQFGWSDVPFNVIKKLLGTVGNSEVILTFSVDALINFMSNRPASKKQFDELGLQFPFDDWESIRSDHVWRRRIQNHLHQVIPSACGAKYYTPFFIQSPLENRDYWLIHLAGHPRARDVMTGIHWDQSNSCRHYGRSGLQMLGYDPEDDPSLYGQNSFDFFKFDVKAELDSVRSLTEDIPLRLYEFREGMTFENFYALVANETPATSTLIAQSIKQLSISGDVSIVNPDGKESIRGRLPVKNDRIMPPRTKSIFLMDQSQDD